MGGVSGRHHREYPARALHIGIYPADLPVDAPEAPPAEPAGGQAGEKGPPEGAEGDEVQVPGADAVRGHPPAGDGGLDGGPGRRFSGHAPAEGHPVHLYRGAGRRYSHQHPDLRGGEPLLRRGCQIRKALHRLA